MGFPKPRLMVFLIVAAFMLQGCGLGEVGDGSDKPKTGCPVVQSGQTPEERVPNSDAEGQAPSRNEATENDDKVPASGEEGKLVHEGHQTGKKAPTEKSNSEETEAGREEAEQGKAIPDDAEKEPRMFPEDWKEKGDHGNEEKEPSLAERLLLPLSVTAAVLAGAVGWLLYDRRKRTNTDVLQQINVLSNIPMTTGESVRSLSGDEEVHVLHVGCFQNIGQREEQQDSFCLSGIEDKSALLEKGLLAVVADGMGGLEGGAAISQLVTDTIRERYSRMDIAKPEAFLYEAAREAEQATEEYMRRTGVKGGSTLVAVLVRGNSMHFLSVGDSRIYLLKDGKLKQLNREHTLGAILREKAERGEVDSEEPFVNPQRHALVAYIGMGSFYTVDRGSLSLAVGDKILLCSDGVFNALGDEAIIEMMSKDAPASAEAMEAAVLSQQIPTQDNFTGVILEYGKKENNEGK